MLTKFTIIKIFPNSYNSNVGLFQKGFNEGLINCCANKQEKNNSNCNNSRPTKKRLGRKNNTKHIKNKTRKTGIYKPFK